MALILCIETATTNCSVSLGGDGEVLALKEDYSNGYSHGERLHLYIQQILQDNRLHPDELQAIAVSKGPGSYTGLRIGVSAAKGLFFSLDIPLLSVPTLDSLARQAFSEEVPVVIPMLDARRMEVYTAGYTGKGVQLFTTRAEVLHPESYKEYLEAGPVAFIGNGVEKFSGICRHPNAKFIRGKLPSAKEMIPLAERAYQDGSFENVAYFEPYYLKDFMAG